jgi:hypothetical protein
MVKPTQDIVQEVTPAYPVESVDVSTLPVVMQDAAREMMSPGNGGVVDVMQRRITEIMSAETASDILAVEPVDIEDVAIWPGAMTLVDFTLHQGDKLDNETKRPTIYAALQLSGTMDDGTPWRVITTCGGKILLAQLIRLKKQGHLPKENVKFRMDDTSSGNVVYSIVNAKPIHPFRRYQG